MISTIDSLYRELLITAMILFAIVLYNNLALYKRKVRDPLSLMLLSGMVMCAFELLWEFCDGHTDLSALLYIGGCGYTIAFLIYGTNFNYFFLNRFGIIPNKKWFSILFYVFPNVMFFMICASTPWTHLIFKVDSNGVLQEMALFSVLFYGLLMVYLLTSLGCAVYFTISSRKKDTVTRKIAGNMIIFGIMAPLFFVVQMLILGSDSDYLALSLSVAIALIYLTTNVNTHLLLESQAKIEATETDLRIAAKIQTDALPAPSPEFANHLEINLRASMNTAREVGGDFYDHFEIDDHRLCFLMADVSGKGTPAALFMMTVKTMIKDYALTHENTNDIFTTVNSRLCEKNEENMFATAWIGILDTRTMKLQYTNAGHCYPLFQRSGEACTQLKEVHGLFLGGMEYTRYKKSEIELRDKDRLLLFTDGVTEAHNSSNELYGESRLSRVLEKASNESGEALLNMILKDINDFAGETPQFDDITMMVLTIKQ